MFNQFVYVFPLGVFDSLTPLLKPFDKEHAMLHVLHVNEIRKCIQEERERVRKVYLINFLIFKNILTNSETGECWKNFL